MDVTHGLDRMSKSEHTVSRERGANIVHASQHGDPEQNLFFTPREW